MTRHLSKYIINNDTFIKVELKENNQIVYVDIFYKVNNKYRVISINELPNQIINLLSINKSYPLSTNETKHFLSFFENLKIDIKNEMFKEKIILGNVFFTNYMLSKDKKENYYVLQNIIVNEFGIMTHNSPIMTPLVPEIFKDIIIKNKQLKKELFLISEDTFVQLKEVQGKILGVIHQIQLKNPTQANVQIIGIFLIEKSSNGYVISTNEVKIKSLKNLDKILEQETLNLIKKLDLKQI